MTFSTDALFLTDEIAGLRECRETRAASSMTFLLCESGSINVVLNRQTIHIGPNDLYVRIPTYGQELGPYDYSNDFRFKQVTVSSAIYDEMMFAHMRVEPRWWQKQEYMKNHPVFHLSEQDIEYVNAYYLLISLQLKDERTAYRKQILMSLARAVTMEMFNYLDKGLVVPQELPRESVDSSDYIFHEFVNMLHQYPHQREVQWFAHKLSITPKYLSEISKSRSGKSASEWIADVTVAELKHRLRNSTLSIRDVAKEMEFPNTSFFCQYTKKHTGYTPNQFRKMRRD
ncbi:MAG: helix-turn-helix domain-containing protein [Paludibacteraceae bacterium]|nr:helix-turn-helix domain-containing protein [Paludibacteraceae bacterium]